MVTYRIGDGIESRQKDMVGKDFCQECLCTSSGMGPTVRAVEKKAKKNHLPMIGSMGPGRVMVHALNTSKTDFNAYPTGGTHLCCPSGYKDCWSGTGLV